MIASSAQRALGGLDGRLRVVWTTLAMRALAAGLALTLLGYLSLAWFVRFVADDWGYAAMSRHGVISATVDSYRGWSGRR